MGLASGIVVFVVLWWIVFFMALPIAIESDPDVPVGHDLGAPQKSYLGFKILGTTVVTTILWFMVTAFLKSLHNA